MPPCDDVQLPSLCLPALNHDCIHFTRSMPSYMPAKLNDGNSGCIIMRPLAQLEFCHYVYGGPLTRRRNRPGIRVRKNDVYYGTVRKGTIQCDPSGRINARVLNNHRQKAIAAANRLFGLGVTSAPCENKDNSSNSCDYM